MTLPFPSAAQLCGTAGKDGMGNLTGVVNTDYPGTAPVAAGAASIPVGAPTGSGTAVSAGDMLLVIQMQGGGHQFHRHRGLRGRGHGFRV